MNDRRDEHFEGQSPDDIACAFCGKRPHQVAAMISGPNGIYVCDECGSFLCEECKNSAHSICPDCYGRLVKLC